MVVNLLLNDCLDVLEPVLKGRDLVGHLSLHFIKLGYLSGMPPQGRLGCQHSCAKPSVVFRLMAPLV